jgi:hypothetical protein
MQNKIYCNALAAGIASLLLLPALAHADISATATLSDFRVKATDLSPGDINPAGYFASYTMSDFFNANFRKTHESSAIPWDFAVSNEYDDRYYQSLSSAGFGELHSVTRATAEDMRYLWNTSGSSVLYVAKLTVLPYTRLDISVDYLGVTTRDASDSYRLYGFTSASMYYYVNGSRGDSVLVGSDGYLPADGNQQFASLLSMNLTNNSARKMDYLLFMDAGTSVRNYAPIPEPSSLAMLAVGALPLGGLARCRRAARQRNQESPWRNR